MTGTSKLSLFVVNFLDLTTDQNKKGPKRGPFFYESLAFVKALATNGRSNRKAALRDNPGQGVH